MNAAGSEALISNENDNQRFEVRRIQVSGEASTHPKALDFTQLNRLAREKRGAFPANMNIDELHQIADQLTLAVRARGFLFHQVYVPPQQVDNGVVRFVFTEAVLTDINLINLSGVSDTTPLKVLQPLLNAPLYAPDVEQRVDLLKAQHNLQVFAFYSRADDNGGVRLNVRLNDAEYPRWRVRAENYGSPSTGEYRIIPTFTERGLITGFDSLTVALLATAGEGDTLHGFARYRLPSRGLKHYLEISAGDTNYEVGADLSALALSGNSRQYHASLGRVLTQQRARYSALYLAGNRRESRVDSHFDPSLANDERSEALELGWHYQSWRASSRFNASLSATRGVYYSDRLDRLQGEARTRELQKGEYSGYFSHRWGTEKIGFEPMLYVRGQFADQDLPGIEEISQGGIYGVRAMEPGRYSADSAWLATVELRLPLHFGGSTRLTPYLLWDASQGDQYGVNESLDVTTALSGAGAGLRWQWSQLSVDLTFATPTEEKREFATGKEEFDSDAQWLFEIRWR